MRAPLKITQLYSSPRLRTTDKAGEDFGEAEIMCGTRAINFNIVRIKGGINDGKK